MNRIQVQFQVWGDDYADLESKAELTLAGFFGEGATFSFDMNVEPGGQRLADAVITIWKARVTGRKL